MLTEALPHWLLAEIEDKETGLNTVSIQDFFDHAFDRHGQVHDNLVDEYTTIYNSPINISKGFNAYVKQQEECHLAAKGQLHVGQTGLFHEKCLQWKRQGIALKPWTKFKTFWNREFSDYKTLSRILSKEAGFGANAAHQTNPNIHELEEAMDNLAFAATTSNN
eukprot:13501770-Ditylum_brightwellii.AAC.1